MRAFCTISFLLVNVKLWCSLNVITYYVLDKKKSIQRIFNLDLNECEKGLYFYTSLTKWAIDPYKSYKRMKHILLRYLAIRLAITSECPKWNSNSGLLVSGKYLQIYFLPLLMYSFWDYAQFWLATKSRENAIFWPNYRVHIN